MVEETYVPGENHRPVASHSQTLSHKFVSSTPHLSGIRTHNFSNTSYVVFQFILSIDSSRKKIPAIFDIEMTTRCLQLGH